jgi:hypothetical protein
MGKPSCLAQGALRLSLPRCAVETLGWRSHEHERCLVHFKGILAQHFHAQLISNDNEIDASR